MEASSEILLKALRELLGGTAKGAAMELLKVVPYKLYLEAPWELP